jgi:hypothetical protein
VIFHYVGVEAVTAVIMKSYIFWDITLSSPLKLSQRFGRICRLLLQVRRSQTRNQRKEGSICLFFDPEDGRGMLLRNIGCLSTDNTALYPRR